MRKELTAAAGLVLFAVIVLPGVVIGILGADRGGGGKGPMKAESPVIHVYLHEKGQTAAMPLEEYVEGVVAAEMPAAFEPAALEAQAVAARTYAVKAMRSFGGSGLAGHDDADVSTDFAVCQAYADADTLKERWGKNYDAYRKKIARAVDRTRGEAAMYDDKPISALFHSTSGARTASAKEVWGNDFAYLQSVDCEWDQSSPRYSDTKEIPLAELEQTLGSDAGVATALQSGAGEVVHIVSLTESGRVKEVRVGSKNFTGQELRKLLGLRSENFTAAQQGDKLVFRTVGYGHGVGMCQYGANGLAKLGKTCDEILQHYYRGIALKNIYGERG